MREHFKVATVQTPTEREAPFHFEELFFSRTDERGKIMAGNALFQRISCYPWSELLGKPHNVIRHEGMPRGVFWLLWDRIRRGLPTGAYVKNRTKEGSYYWVYAIVTPIERGYLSVRLKPSSKIFHAVRESYDALLLAEAEDHLTPAQGAERLLAAIRPLGYETYEALMAEALVAELLGRNTALNRTIRPDLIGYGEMMSFADKLLNIAKGITDAYRSYRFVPLNLLVQAGRLGGAGAAIGTISSNYNLLSAEIQESLQHFQQTARQVSDAIHRGAFLLATSHIQQEIAAHFGAEAALTEFDHEKEREHLIDQQRRYEADTLESLTGIQGELMKFSERVSDMKRLASGLAAIRVMGKVEAGRLSTGVLKDLITDLEAFQDVLGTGLGDIAQVTDLLRLDVIQLLNDKLVE